MAAAGTTRLNHIEGLERRFLLALFGPDPSFGSDGIVAVPGETVLAPLPDGKIFAVGHRSIPIIDVSDALEDRLMIVSRLNPDGTLDSSFHDGGTVELALTSHGSSSDAEFTGSRLWVLVYLGLSPEVPELRAYTPDLVLDTSFSDDGRTQMPSKVDFDSVSDRATGVILGTTADGGLVLHMDITDVLPTGGSIRRDDIVKVAADGTVDTAFGTNGFVLDAPERGVRWTRNGLLIL